VPEALFAVMALQLGTMAMFVAMRSMLPAKVEQTRSERTSFTFFWWASIICQFIAVWLVILGLRSHVLGMNL
jgi:hypothetical protein